MNPVVVNDTEIDVQRFKVLDPIKDVSFWAAIVFSLTGLMNIFSDNSISTGEVLAALAPITAWLTLHGVIRSVGVAAYGKARAAEVTSSAAVRVATAKQAKAV